MKTKHIILSGLFLACIASCKDNDEQVDDDWISGDADSRDTVANGQTFRYYHAFWYPVYNNMISPASYNGATISEVGRPGFTPTRIGSGEVETGGFGGTGHGEGGGGE